MMHPGYSHVLSKDRGNTGHPPIDVKTIPWSIKELPPDLFH